ncbi:hypothetical protein BDW59DRAFT_161114 [Aspergillus cavernicola]|uniref:Uncharacterized protein n=1 Tax=Aspergillus cavernicola TaxID=176166 RepID=A0ABR4IEV1_9EURO
MNAIMNVAGLVITGWSFASMFSGQDVDPEKQTTVTLLNGNAPNSDGSIPHLALWDENGNRIGQYKGNANGHLDKGSTKTFPINPTQNGGHQANAEYLLLSMEESDAICLSVITVSGNSQQWTWTGDMGYTCGVQWFHSSSRFGGSNKAIRCVWLDKDHSAGIKAEGVSLHMPSFSADDPLVNQYKKNQRRLCQVTNRMTFHRHITSDSLVGFFNPPIQYTENGALKHPNRGIDRKQRGYPDLPRSHGRDWASARNSSSSVHGLKNNQPDRLIVSSLEGQSARELCEHENSLGPDFVHTGEKLFCDMETAKLWPVCGETGEVGCFDVNAREMRNPPAGSEDAKGIGADGNLRAKKYKEYEEW